MANEQLRLAFAEFLKRVGAGKVDAIEWGRVVATHYHDDALEDIRMKLARMSIARESGKDWSDLEFAALQQWSRELRGSNRA